MLEDWEAEQYEIEQDRADPYNSIPFGDAQRFEDNLVAEEAAREREEAAADRDAERNERIANFQLADALLRGALGDALAGVRVYLGDAGLKNFTDRFTARLSDAGVDMETLDAALAEGSLTKLAEALDPGQGDGMVQYAGINAGAVESESR